MKMGGIADGFYQTGRELKERPKLLSTPPGKGLQILMIKVNSIGAKVLEFISNFGRPSALVPTTIVAYVPNKVLVDGFGEIESSSEITDAIKSGLEEPIEAEPELKVPKELISLSELEELKLQHRPSFVAPSRELNFTKVHDKEARITQRRLSNTIPINYI